MCCFSITVAVCNARIWPHLAHDASCNVWIGHLGHRLVEWCKARYQRLMFLLETCACMLHDNGHAMWTNHTCKPASFVCFGCFLITCLWLLNGTSAFVPASILLHWLSCCFVMFLCPGQRLFQVVRRKSSLIYLPDNLAISLAHCRGRPFGTFCDVTPPVKTARADPCCKLLFAYLTGGVGICCAPLVKEYTTNFLSTGGMCPRRLNRSVNVNVASDGCLPQ